MEVGMSEHWVSFLFGIFLFAAWASAPVCVGSYAFATGSPAMNSAIDGTAFQFSFSDDPLPRNVMKYLVEWFEVSYDTDEPAPGKPFNARGRFKSLLFDLPGVALAFENDGEIGRAGGDFKWQGTAVIGVTVEMSVTLTAPGIEKWEIDHGAPALGVPETIRLPGTLGLVAEIPFPYERLVAYVKGRAADLYPDEALREELLEDLAMMKAKADENNGIFRFGRGSSISLYLETWSFKRAGEATEAGANGPGKNTDGKKGAVMTDPGQADPKKGGVK